MAKEQKTLQVKIVRPCFVGTDKKAIGDVVELPFADGKYLVALGKATEDLKWQPPKPAAKPEAKK